MTKRFACSVLSSLFLVIACGGSDPEPAPDPDPSLAGSSGAGGGAAAGSASAGGTAGSGGNAGSKCTGFPTSCSSRGTTSCKLGCALGNGSCGGVASDSCYGASHYACLDTEGCYWSSSTSHCNGVGPSCISKYSSVS